MGRKSMVNMNGVRFGAASLAAALIIVGCGRSETGKTDEFARVTLLPDSWEMTDGARPVSILGESKTTESLPAAIDVEKGFTVSLKANLSEPTRKRRILEIPGVLELNLRPHNPLDRDKQNYPAYSMPDGSVPVLEALLYLASPLDGEVRPMPVGIPLAMLDKPYGEHDITLDFSGPRWTMYVDGDLMDNDFPFGYPDKEKMGSWRIDPDFVSGAEIRFPASEFKRVGEATCTVPVQYWTPYGHNSWVGDVVSLYHDDTYHLFYLYDRRGHQSKFGRGGHYFEHLSTKDFIHWTEHEAAVPIEEQWETFGTGTPFVSDGNLCISYGYHTTRLYPRDMTTLPEMYDYLNRHGYTGSFDRHDMKGIAAGSSYSVSEDGVDFKKTGVLFHPCENPSIYVDPEGELKMLANYGARGTWTADAVNGNWRCVDENFPWGGDCTFFFNWGDYDYIIGGFTNLWSRKSGDGAYDNVVASGEDFYNGLCVPTISRIFDGRYVMAGWTWMKAWGGALVIHELVQLPGGRIGTKWMEELVPVDHGKTKSLPVQGDNAVDLPYDSFMLTFDVTPGDSPESFLALDLLPEEDAGTQDACGMRIYDGGSRAQYGGVGTKFSREKSLREGGAPQGTRDYAIEKLIDTDKPYKVRMIVKYSTKFDGSLVDTEIAGRRTMVSYREKLKAGRIRFTTADTRVGNVTITPLAE